MLGKLFLLFTLVPLLELLLLLEIGERLGAGPTLALVVGTGLLGAALARHEGARVLRSWQESMARMQVPEEGVLSGALVLLGAVLLITPGVLTDVAGLTLLFPPTRRLFAARLRHWAERRLQIHTVHAFSAGAGEVGSVSPGAVIDVEAEDARGAESS